MFAGPNGSGKSSLKEVVRPDLLGIYLNADEIEAALRTSGGFDLGPFLQEGAVELHRFFENSSLLAKVGLVDAALRMPLKETRLSFGNVEGNSYFAAVVADFARRNLIQNHRSFSFETVMSSRDKVLLLKEAQSLGYRTYLYYIATEDPEINVSRVENRVQMGGHGVPRQKIVDRYARSLALLPEAIHYSDRAYLFDNSGESVDRVWLAEFTGGTEMELRTTRVPNWFNAAVLDQLAD
jgi:predicted ABC-type ATPase